MVGVFKVMTIAYCIQRRDAFVDCEARQGLQSSFEEIYWPEVALLSAASVPVPPARWVAEKKALRSRLQVV